MVFFTCNACGESVKKVQVEKHVAVCRNCECLSCIDCGEDFWGDDYKNHVKCVSEDQKYGGKGYEGKAHRGDLKQQAWLQKINELMRRSNISPKVKELLEQISGFDNVPRKKAKFQNWMKNSLRVHSEAVLEQVWNIMSEASSSGVDDHQKHPGPAAPPSTDSTVKAPSSGADEMAARPTEAKNKRERKEERQKNRKKEKKELRLDNHQENGKGQKAKKRKVGQVAEARGEAAASTGPHRKKKQKGQQAVNGASTEDEVPRASAGKRKRKHSESAVLVDVQSKKKKTPVPGQTKDEEAAHSAETPARGKFNWKGTIKAVLKQAPDNEIAVKKLRKKVLAQYYTTSQEQHLSEEELLAIFNRKISKNPSLKLLKDKVKLLK